MEREAVFQFRQFAAIEVIAADRAADMRQMHANLVGAPGLQPQADERAASGGLLDAVMRHGAPTVGANRAFCARAEAGNRRVDHALARAMKAWKRNPSLWRKPCWAEKTTPNP